MALGLLLLSIIFAIYLFLVPWLGEKMANGVSREWEESLGYSMFESVKQGLEVDSLKSVQIMDFYKQSGLSSPYPIKLAVARSEEVNAFAIPGGYVVVYSGILEKIQKPEQLAALLAHEISHISLRHSLRSIFREMAQQMFLMLIIGNESGVAGYLSSQAGRLKTLQYSRDLETEADLHGLKLMKENGIDGTGMLELMKLLEDGKESGAGEFSFLNTHPGFSERIQNIRKEMIKVETRNAQNLNAAFQLLKTAEPSSDLP